MPKSLKNKILLAVLIMSVVPVSGACVVTRSEGEKMRKDTDVLRADFEKSREQQAALDKERDARIKDLQDKTNELESSIEGVRKAQGNTAVGLGMEQDRIIQKIMELNGRNDLATRRIEELENELKNMKGGIQGSKQAGGAAIQGGRMPEIIRPEKKKDYLALGIKFFNDGQMEAARVILGEYIEKFKDDPECGKAQYYIGESFFKEGKYQNAILEFQKVVSNYPNSEKVEDAAYLLALSFSKIGLFEDAKKLLKEFLKAYPDSKYASAARKKLREMK